MKEYSTKNLYAAVYLMLQGYKIKSLTPVGSFTYVSFDDIPQELHAKLAQFSTLSDKSEPLMVDLLVFKDTMQKLKEIINSSNK